MIQVSLFALCPLGLNYNSFLVPRMGIEGVLAIANFIKLKGVQMILIACIIATSLISIIVVSVMTLIEMKRDYIKTQEVKS
jgi:hypothetical protein